MKVYTGEYQCAQCGGRLEREHNPNAGNPFRHQKWSDDQKCGRPKIRCAGQ